MERIVTLYGKLADVLGSRVLVAGGELAEPVTAIRARIAQLDPRLGTLLADARVRACVADAIATDSTVAGPGEPVEFLPVVSGG